MLERVGFKNFLALRDVEIDLEPFTVIVGPNSSGKSTILEGIERISKLSRGTNEIFLRRSADGKEAFDPGYFLTKGASLDFKFFVSTKTHGVQGLIYKGNNFSLGDEFVTPPTKFETKILKFSASEAAHSSYSESLNPSLEPSGQGLATICSYLQALKPEAFSWIQESLRLIIPNLTRFRVQPARVPAFYWFNQPLLHRYQQISEGREATGHELIFDFENAKNLLASQVSEGTLFALSVLSSVASLGEDGVVLIDDLERGLHPKAVRELMLVLRKIQATNPELQIIATSHSPYVLHSLKPNEVRVVTLDPERGTLVAPLEAYPEFDKWRDAMTPGEFWSFVGEDWVKDLPTLEKTSV